MARLALGPWALAGLACGGPLSALEPRGPGSAQLAELFWFLLVMVLAPALIAIGFLIYATRRPRPGEGPRGPLQAEPRSTTVTILVVGAALPLILIFFLLARTFRVGSEVTKIPAEVAVTIDVIGHQFWWEVLYPDHQIASANEIHIPAGRDVRFRITAADVIHSFWIPQLQAKRDMTPGHIETVYLRADEPGIYRGACYEFCGIQHALMGFELVAHPAEAFEAWLAREREPAAAPTDALGRRGLEVYRQAECDSCHPIQGLVPKGAMGVVGPDLTHFASRRTLAAASWENNRGFLGGWILDPQAMKPGSRMPPSVLDPEELDALLHFLEGLR